MFERTMIVLSSKVGNTKQHVSVKTSLELVSQPSFFNVLDYFGIVLRNYYDLVQYRVRLSIECSEELYRLCLTPLFHFAAII